VLILNIALLWGWAKLERLRGSLWNYSVLFIP